ncbi:hypothetical protein C0Q70_16216 [Pomacea canaliculata]|uniref:Protein-tyrosine-phosphatase n=1 Tax=Pomacea canaliculata TaxID=400727 RepID=A0A2T7NP75_POMCA|nr:hypothetical protein C0Q70_16216 [Pomacea canaliculata]
MVIRKETDLSFADDLHVFMRRQCPVGYFGFQCRFRCRCRANDDCNKVTGGCPRGCAYGFWGPGCQLSNRCFYNGQKRSYMGTINRTREGMACQAWGVQLPHEHTYEQTDFPDGRYPDNHCRTTSDSSMPWCYTIDPTKRWSYCDITNCVCPAGLFGHSCSKMCHCKDPTEMCDTMFGMCKSSCDEGWEGFDCQTPAPCPQNRYGWSCESECKCRNSSHCHRFTGPTEACQCRPGFFNPPHCEPVTKPRIVEFTNREVNPNQPSEFNCTVSAFPTPLESDIRLQAPDRRSVTLVRSVELPDYSYTRMNTFMYVRPDERYTCFVQGTAGTTSLTAHVKVFELPRLLAPPGVVHGSITANNATIEWRKWNPERGDPGHPEILWYNVYVRSATENVRMAGIVYHAFCQEKCRYTLTGLQPNTRYFVYLTVRREGNGGDGPEGPTIHLTTKCAAPHQPPAIETLTAELEYNASVPLTRLIIRWNDPPRDSISCNRIAKYVVEMAPPPGQGETRSWELPGGTNRMLSVPGLQPFTEYCVSLYLQTDAGYSSPRSDQACIVTPQTTPAAPLDLKVVRTSSTSVTFSWSRPEPVRGNISLYRVLFWPLNSTGAKGVEWRSNNRYVEYTLTGLRPLTTYQLQVQAVNEAGTGEGTPALTFSTLEDVPGPVRGLRNVSRTQHSIRFEWQPPSNPGGKLLHYSVACDMVKTLIGGQPVLSKELQVGAGTNREIVNGLSAATLYNCSVRASTAKGPGQPATILVWTEAEDPRTPIAPIIKSVTDTTVTLDIHHSGDLAVSFYRVIVERLDHHRGTERRRRHTPSHLHDLETNFQTAVRDGLSAYITAQLSRQQVGGAFTVGDNETYDGFFNGPLQRQASYDLWLVAFSSVDGTRRESYAKTESPVIVRAMTAQPPSSHVPVIVGVLIVFIFLILTFAVLLIVWRRRNLSSEREKSELPSFGPTILPEPDSSPPPTPISEGACLLSSLDHVSTEAEPLLEHSSQRVQDAEPVYSNVGIGLQSVPPIKVEDLWDYIRNNKSNDMEGLRREYRMLPAGLIASCEVARKEENKLKNRYGNIIACPNTPTLQDVWRMVWRENSKTLIMLTNLTETGKKKCEQYWPDEEEGCRQYGPISVQLLDTDELPDFTIRTFLLTKGGQSKYLKQFHFTTWPDHGVPRFGHSLLLFRQKIRAYDNLDAGPVIVHCR